jgi:hypothetical protein
MANEDPGDMPDQLEEHSLPGTNQAGKDSRPRKRSDRKNRPRAGEPTHQDHLEEHSLPGTNQAGTGPGSRDITRESK